MLLERRFRKHIITLSFIFLVISAVLINNYKPAKNFVKLYYTHSYEIVFTSMDLFNNKIDYEVKSHHLKTFNAELTCGNKKRFLVQVSSLLELIVNLILTNYVIHIHTTIIELLLDIG